MSKHAYCIMAHKTDETFWTLLSLLDDIRNDVFIHMDAKVSSWNCEEARSRMRRASVRETSRRISVTWGAYSQIEVELLLLDSVLANGGYSHIHLLSGQDLPIKTQDEIHAYFDEHTGEEFIRFQGPVFQHADRVRYRWFFQDRIGRSRRNLLGIAQKALVAAQRVLHLERNRDMQFQKGDNWCSITEDLARLVVSKRDWIRRVFSDSLCADEVFLQTIVFGSPFIESLHCVSFDDDERAFMRRIKWEDEPVPSPSVWRLTDVDDLLMSDMMFARKFDSAVDIDAVHEVARRVGGAGGAIR